MSEDSNIEARRLEQVTITLSANETNPLDMTEDNSEKNGETKQKEEEGWQHSKYEVGCRVIKESNTGEEVSIRNILLDDTDGGTVENILFEEGVNLLIIN